MTTPTGSRSLRLMVATGALLATLSQAEDADRFRSYFRFHSGDIEPLWGVDDHWSMAVGANFNRYLGAELAFDYYLRDWGEPEAVGEVSSYHLIPELRVRYPLWKDRLVPYLIGGIGPSWVQGKDVKAWAFNQNPTVEGFTFSVAAGAGLEYFIADNATFGIEGRYVWVNPVDGTVGGVTQSADLSAPLFTFGLRIYFDENTPRLLMSEEAHPASRFYFGTRMGANLLTDRQWVPGVRFTPEQAAWGGVASQTGGLLLGYDIGPHLGIEVSGDHINHGVEVDGLGEVAEYGQGWVLANLRFRFPHRRWSPYFYLGGGVNYSEFKDYKPGSAGLDLRGQNIHPAVNAGAGTEYFIARNFSLTGDVRWAYSWDHSFGIENLVPESKGDLSYVGLTIGFHLYLSSR